MEILSKGKLPEIPQIILIHNFIPDSEVDRLLELLYKQDKRPAMAYDTKKDEEYEDHEFRRCSMVHLPTEEFGMMIQRSCELTGWDSDLFERPKPIHYGPGEFVGPHSDHSAENSRLQRVATFVTYLKEPEEGGHTVFPELGISIKPKKGSSLFMNYIPHKTPKAIHLSDPVIKGEKWIVTSFMYQKDHHGKLCDRND